MAGSVWWVRDELWEAVEPLLPECPPDPRGGRPRVDDLAAIGQQLLPDGLTPHSLRRTFASLLFALGEPPTYVMSQMGHTTPGLTLALYAREMNRRDGERQRLRALVTDEPQKPAATAPSTATATGSVRIIPVHGKAITARTADGEPARRS